MDSQLKQRLVGAIVLVGAAVVFIPMLLRPPAGESGAGAAPSTAERPGFSSSVVPLEEPRPASRVATPAAPESPRPTPAAAPAPPPTPAPVPTSSPEARPAPSPPAPAPPPSPPPARTPAATGEWVIQLGSFSNARNASGLTERLRKKGYPAFTRPAQTSRGSVTRVYVGPSSTREAANAVVKRLQGETNLRGIVVRDGGG